MVATGVPVFFLSHWYDSTRKNTHGESEIRTWICRSRGRCLNHWANEAVGETESASLDVVSEGLFYMKQLIAHTATLESLYRVRFCGLVLRHPPREPGARGSIPVFPSRQKKMVLKWLPCQASGVIGSAIGLGGPVSLYCDWVSEIASLIYKLPFQCGSTNSCLKTLALDIYFHVAVMLSAQGITTNVSEKKQDFSQSERTCVLLPA